MLQKAQEERQEVEAKLEEIRLNHAAKVIQKAWKIHDKIVKSNPKGKNKGKKDQPKKNVPKRNAK
jgi:hypothetical protein